MRFMKMAYIYFKITFQRIIFVPTMEQRRKVMNVRVDGERFSVCECR